MGYLTFLGSPTPIIAEQVNLLVSDYRTGLFLALPTPAEYQGIEASTSTGKSSASFKTPKLQFSMFSGHWWVKDSLIDSHFWV